jgi:hypothetical protein
VSQATKRGPKPPSMVPLTHSVHSESRAIRVDWRKPHSTHVVGCNSDYA